MKQLRLFTDVETSGLNPQKHAIIQIAGIMELNGKVVEEFSWNMKPEKGKFVDPEALKVNGSTIEEIREYEDSSIVYKRFLALLDKYINKYNSKEKAYFYAYNSPFDQAFIEKWFKDNKNDYLFSYSAWPWVDVAVIAAIYAEKQRDKMPNFKQGTVAKALGIEVDDAKLHDALYDIQIMKQLYEKLEVAFST